MPFTEMTKMDDRLCFVAACLRGEESMQALCERFGISRKTGYKWLGRYRDGGVSGLEDRKRTPRTLPHRISASTGSRILDLRACHPSWGPRKLLARLRMDDPAHNWPAASTVGDLLKREGLVRQRHKQRRSPSSTGPSVKAEASNDSWSADFKGWFRVGDGVRCEPLTISDNFSRYLFTCEAVPRRTTDLIKLSFIKVFREHGLPKAMRTDNGSPFAHHSGLGGLTRLSVWFLQLDIWPDRISPGRPDQNGRHERMHRTLEEDTACPPASTFILQQERLERWRQDYNIIRPHEALENRTPAEIYQSSVRTYPETIPAWTYPQDHHVRHIDSVGYFKWRDRKIYLSEALIKQTIAIAPIDDGNWLVRFRNFDLALIDDRTNTLTCSPLARSNQK